MLYLLESPVGIAIIQNTEGISLLAKMIYSSSDSAIQTFGALNGSGDILPEVDVFLKNNIPEAAEMNVLSQEVVRVLSSRYNLKAILSPDDVFRQIRINPFKWFGVNKDVYNAMTMRIARQLVSTKQDDFILIETLNTIELLERSINTRTMRIRGWYSLHFPELNTISDNNEYLKFILTIGDRKKYTEDLEALGADEKNNDLSEHVLKALNSSMGVNMKEKDILKIKQSTEDVLNDVNQKKTLMTYLNEKCSIAFPNLHCLCGEVLTAKLLRKTGSISMLSQTLSSTIQILGAEKAFNEAVKAGTNTPKYGFIFESKLVSKASPSVSGKMSRALANKIALCARVDVSGGAPDGSFGRKAKAYLEALFHKHEDIKKMEKPPVKKQKKKVISVAEYDQAKDSHKRVKQE
ncbi:nucleolar protein 56 [Pancytospora epiphaga]|nr:nucleolar protein 56 [Pancytospora epiphaga]